MNTSFKLFPPIRWLHNLRLQTFGTWVNPRTEPGQEDWRVLVMSAPSAFSL